MVLLFIAVTGTLIAARSMIERKRLDGRKHEVARAFYIAEGGASQVVHWAIHPEDYTEDPSLFAPSQQGELSTLEVALASQGSLNIPASALSDFTSSDGKAIGEIKEITLLPRDAGDPPNTEFKIQSVGSSVSGIERTVTYHVTKNSLYTTSFPAAVMSYQSAAANGNVRVHWGEVWAKGGINMLNRSQMDYLKPGNAQHDPWAKYKAVGAIQFPNNWRWGSGKDLFGPTAQQPGQAPASGDYADAFYQNVASGDLAFPTFDYAEWKQLAMKAGKFFSTDADGEVYRNGVEDEAHRILDPLLEFSVEDREDLPYDIAFVDTIDGNPPAADGSNLATLKFSGNSTGMKGFFYFAANIDATGIGNVPGLDATRPDGQTVPLDKVLLDGALISEGTVTMSGNATVYGSVVAKRGFGGTGTVDIYYNSELADRPDAPPFAAPIRLGMFKNY